MTREKFDIDPYPGRPKILFIGLPQSSHTQSWIDLLAGSEFNVRLFGVPSGFPPPTWKIRTYVTINRPPDGLELEPEFRRSLYPTPEEEVQRSKKLKRNPILWLFTLAAKAQGRIGSLPGIFSARTGNAARGFHSRAKAASPEAWLAEIIREWKPDVIHTLGLDHEQGGFFYYGVRKSFGLEKYGKWVLQLRGGSDLTLNRHDPVTTVRIAEVLKECDQIICDNVQNIVYAGEMGVSRDKFASLVPIPGTGGIDVGALSGGWMGLPSQRRAILWPKAYNCPWSTGLPVLEALKNVWKRIRPCSIHMLCMTSDVRMWFNALPAEIRQHCLVYERIPRQDVLSLMQQSRIMLAPSLVDGVPNTLYESMATGAFPIVSPLETIRTVVENERNVLFARNLYPDEIAEATVRAMNDDALVDVVAQRNLDLVRKIADRAAVCERVSKYYQMLLQGNLSL